MVPPLRDRYQPTRDTPRSNTALGGVGDPLGGCPGTLVPKDLGERVLK